MCTTSIFYKLNHNIVVLTRSELLRTIKLSTASMSLLQNTVDPQSAIIVSPELKSIQLGSRGEKLARPASTNTVTPGERSNYIPTPMERNLGINSRVLCSSITSEALICPVLSEEATDVKELTCRDHSFRYSRR